MESTDKAPDHGPTPLTIDSLLDNVQAGSPHLGRTRLIDNIGV